MYLEKKSYFQIYNDPELLLRGLRDVEARLFVYLKRNADERNLVRFDDFAKYKFIDILDEEYTYATISKSLSILVKSGLILKRKKCIYQLNPKYYWKGEISKRENELKKIDRERKNKITETP